MEGRPDRARVEGEGAGDRLRRCRTETVPLPRRLSRPTGQAKYDKLIRFAERLPALREVMADDIALDEMPEEKVAAIAVRLINLGWFRVGSDRYAKSSRTFGITTLHKRHVTVRGSRISFRYRGKHGILIHSAIIDAELAAAVKELMRVSRQPAVQVRT